MSSFGEEIRRQRKAKGMTQAALAASSGMTTRQVIRLERGQCEPSDRTLQRLAHALGCEIRRSHGILIDAVLFSLPR